LEIYQRLGRIIADRFRSRVSISLGWSPGELRSWRKIDRRGHGSPGQATNQPTVLENDPRNPGPQAPTGRPGRLLRPARIVAVATVAGMVRTVSGPAVGFMLAICDRRHDALKALGSIRVSMIKYAPANTDLFAATNLLSQSRKSRMFGGTGFY
jgi:hypothetical protein